jgi:hypothetical protein
MIKYRNRTCPTIICCMVNTNGGQAQFCNVIFVVTIHNILITYHESSANTTMILSMNDVVVVLLLLLFTSMEVEVPLEVLLSFDEDSFDDTFLGVTAKDDGVVERSDSSSVLGTRERCGNEVDEEPLRDMIAAGRLCMDVLDVLSP